MNTDKKARNKSSDERVLEALKKYRVATIATVDRDQKPHLAAVYYTVADDFKLRFATKTHTRKHLHLITNSDVDLLIFDERSQTTLKVSGSANIISDAAREMEIIEETYAAAYRNSFSSPPISQLDAGQYVAYEVSPALITLAQYGQPNDNGRQIFETIDFTKS